MPESRVLFSVFKIWMLFRRQSSKIKMWIASAEDGATES